MNSFYNHPSRTEIIEAYWVEYLEHLANDPIKDTIANLTADDGDFWRWYIEEKLGADQ